MTLNLTVTTPWCIYQCADYRLVDWTSGQTRDFETQKIVLKTAFTWHATICFAGVGRTSGLNVGDWLAERLNSVSADEPFESLLEALLKADEWLANVPLPYNRHSFSVGAFVESQPVFALVSNFEQLEGPPRSVASQKLSVFKVRPTQAKTFVSGQSEAVGRPERRKLAALAASDPDSQVMYEELIRVILWCWRCKTDMPMVDEVEWGEILAAKEAAEARDHLREASGEQQEGFLNPMLKAYARITGFQETNVAAIWHHRLSLYGPPCLSCGKPLRTPEAKLCTQCGERRSEYQGA